MCRYELKRTLSKKTQGGYATVEHSLRGTLLKFVGSNKPIAIEAADESFVLDTAQFVVDITAAGVDISQIRDAVKYPAAFLNNRYASKTINGIISMNPILNAWIHQYGDCDLDIALNAINMHGIDLNVIRNNIRTYISAIDNVIALSLDTAYQGNIHGNDSVSRKFITYSDTDMHIPNYRRPVNTIHPGQATDPFIAKVLNNNMFRGWYGKINSRVDPQYVRFTNITDNPLILELNAPDTASSKTPKDEMADIIPAGTVRSSIMLLIRAFLNDPRWRIGGGAIPNANMAELYDMISYITLLAGLANAYGNTTHIKEYNGSIGDRYGRDATML